MVVDFDADGCMDVLYSGGVFTTGKDTNIRVMYGKVRNVPAPLTKASPAPKAPRRHSD